MTETHLVWCEDQSILSAIRPLDGVRAQSSHNKGANNVGSRVNRGSLTVIYTHKEAGGRSEKSNEEERRIMGSEPKTLSTVAWDAVRALKICPNLPSGEPLMKVFQH
ncbi:hypothetical protein M569_17741 [Genlisea aurea]|uniref:Uncharacterized protein n=1 Tax=Genlisea aurea TaxID=192259 RepID=S8BRP7_9LAMI|nr:hypothetical protein M569_17741 [Genlisea aurea]